MPCPPVASRTAGRSNQTTGLPQACGKPVVWFDLPAVREATGGQGIAIPPGAVEKMRDAIQHLYDSPDTCKQLGEQARRYVQSKHSWAQLCLLCT